MRILPMRKGETQDHLSLAVYYIYILMVIFIVRPMIKRAPMPMVEIDQEGDVESGFES